MVNMLTNPPAPDQCWPSFYGIATCKCCIRVLYGLAIQRTRDTNIEAGGEGGVGGGEGRGTGKIVYLFFKLSGIDVLSLFNLRIIHKNYEISICFVQ